MDWRTAKIKSKYNMAVRIDKDGNRVYRERKEQCNVCLPNTEEPLLCTDPKIFEGFTDWQPVN